MQRDDEGKVISIHKSGLRWRGRRAGEVSRGVISESCEANAEKGEPADKNLGASARGLQIFSPNCCLNPAQIHNRRSFQSPISYRSN